MATNASQQPQNYEKKRKKIPRGIDRSSWITREQRKDLVYFMTEASQRIACSPHGHLRFSNFIVSLAFESAPVFYATLAFSAAQRASLHQTDIDHPIPVLEYIHICLSRHTNQTHRGSQLATALLLCLVDPAVGTWRIYAKGAHDILKMIPRPDSKKSTNAVPEVKEDLSLLRQWYLHIASLATVTSTPIAETPSVVLLEDVDPDIYHDIHGYPSRLAIFMIDIGAAASKRQQNTDSTEQDFELEARNLQERLLEVTQENTQDQRKGDFQACLDAYISMCHILIERRVGGASSESESVQRAAEHIIESLSSVEPSSKASPVMAVTAPLFVAGCEVLEEKYRDEVRGLLKDFSTKTESGNMKLALKFLESLWTSDRVQTQDWLLFESRWI